MKTKLLLTVFIFIQFSLNAQNLITNGGFESNLTEWMNLTGGNAVASFTRETSDTKSGTGALRAQITTAGTNAWDAQSIHSGWASLTNVTYTLTFYAKAIGTPSKIKLVQQVATYDEKIFDIGTEWTQYTWTFSAKEDNLQLKIHYLQSGTFLLDDFVILDPTVPSGPKTITINTNTSYQQMTGFGGALTWYCDRIISSPKKNEMTQLLFNDLGTDIIRLKNWYYPLNYPASKSPQTMTVNWFGPHYEATNQLATLAKQANPEIDLLLSSWGPPASLKSNDELETGTLKKDNGKFMYSEYGQYWEDILDHITFDPDYISIQNEPGFENAGWTTCGWRPAETTDYPAYSIGFDSVYNHIKNRADMPAMIGPETENLGSASWDNTQNTFRSMSTTVSSKPYLSAYAYHLYNFGSPGGIDNSILNMIKNEFGNKPNFMTEFSSANYDWLQTAHMIQLNLMEANTSAYIYWEMMWDENSTTAMINVDGSGNYTVSPYYYAIKHFSKYINKGDLRVEVAGSTSTLKVTGFVNPDKTTLTLVISNIGVTNETLTLNLGNLPTGSVEGYQSLAGNYFNSLGQVNISQDLEVPGKSLTTLVIPLDCSLFTEADAGADQTVTNSSATLGANSAGTATGTWSVLSGSGSFADNHDPSTLVSGLNAGDNEFLWTISDGTCSSSDLVIVHADILGTGTRRNAATTSNVMTYPNPFTNELNILFTTPSDMNMTLRVQDMKGMVVFESQAYQTNELIRLKIDRPSGIYFVTGTYENGSKTVKVEKY